MTQGVGLRLDRDGPVATLRIDRPEKRNAISRAMWAALPGLAAQVAGDPTIKVLVVRGAGKDFSAGADISEFEANFASRESAAAYTDEMAAAHEALADLPQPTIAVIGGVCMGAGCGVALTCDIRLGDTTARMGVTPAKLGMTYPLAETARLVEAAGASGAADLLFSARIVDAAEAQRIGLLTRLIAAEAFEAEVERYVGMVAGNARYSLGALKQALRLIRTGRGDDTATGRRLFLDALEGPDFAEGRGAFLAGRPARFI